MAHQDPFWIEIFNGTTGTGDPFPCGGAKQVAIEYQWKDDTALGVGLLEHSTVRDFTGVWAEMDSQSAADNTLAFFTYPGPLGFLHIRMTTDASGGALPGLIVRAKRMFD